MGMDVDPDVLSDLASTLRNASTDIEASASAPPQPRAGIVTEILSATLAVLCEGMANVSASAAGLGDAVAQGRDVYVDTDYEQAVALERQQAEVDQPR